MPQEQPQFNVLNFKQFSSLASDVSSLFYYVQMLQRHGNHDGPVGFCVPVGDIEVIKFEQNIPELKEIFLVVLPDEMRRNDAIELAESTLQICYVPIADCHSSHPIVFLQGKNNCLFFSLWEIDSAMALPNNEEGIPLFDESAKVLTIFLHRDTVMVTSKIVDATWSSTSPNSNPMPIFITELFIGMSPNSLNHPTSSPSIVWEMPIKKLNGFAV